MIDRDGYRCVVPGCTSRRNLQDHHVVFRSAGGSNAAENRAPLCAFHHQRGLHAGLLAIRGRAPDALGSRFVGEPLDPPRCPRGIPTIGFQVWIIWYSDHIIWIPDQMGLADVIEGLLGNATAEKVLLYLEAYGEGYASAIADTFEGVSMSMALAQLRRFEAAGLLVSRSQGRTRLFTWNPRYPFRREVRALLRRALASLPEDERRRYFGGRRRPRRSGKPH